MHKIVQGKNQCFSLTRDIEKKKKEKVVLVLVVHIMVNHETTCAGEGLPVTNVVTYCIPSGEKLVNINAKI